MFISHGLRGLFILILSLSLLNCGSSRQNSDFNSKERALIFEKDSTEKLSLLNFEKHQDSIFLRMTSEIIQPKENEIHKHLISRMLATVKDINNPGVGIAAPQIGISKQIILVQRIDKADEPFETYYNPIILEYSEDLQYSIEGCLSIPENVLKPLDRKAWVRVSYQNSENERIEETIKGFTAIIFQHEVDHLNGTLYIDRILKP